MKCNYCGKRFPASKEDRLAFLNMGSYTPGYFVRDQGVNREDAEFYGFNPDDWDNMLCPDCQELIQKKRGNITMGTFKMKESRDRGWEEYEFTYDVGYTAPYIYVGDICYSMDDDIYDQCWGPEYEDGEIKKDGKTIALVTGTAYGDGCYKSHNGKEFYVDAGVIGIVPGKYWKRNFDKDRTGFDIVNVTGYDRITCRLTYDEGEIGVFIKDKENKVIYSNSIYTSEEEEEDEYDDFDPWADYDEELEESFNRNNKHLSEKLEKLKDGTYHWESKIPQPGEPLYVFEEGEFIKFSVIVQTKGTEILFDLGTAEVLESNVENAHSILRSYLKSDWARDDFVDEDDEEDL